MASNVCLKFQSLALSNKMSLGYLKPITDSIKLIPKTHNRFMLTVSSNKYMQATNKNQIDSTNFLNPSATTKCNSNLRRSNINLENGTKRFIKTLSSLLVPDSSADNKIKNSVNQTLPPTESTANLDEYEESVEEHEQTIYKGILSAQIKLVKSFSLMTSAIGLSCQPFLLYQVQSSGAGSLGVALAGGACLSFFTFATPLLIHWVSKKYVTELLYNKIEDSYTAVTYSLLLREKKVSFKLRDVKVPDIPAMFTTIIVEREKQIPLFVDGVHAFSDPQHYAKLMGYDKPLNLRWDKEADASQGVVDARRRKAARRNANIYKHK